ncbi:MAG: ParB/RepB/Spo0J family partition protein [Tenericutes bacterium]|nr:ParB/RepB/Spo0J family partition protein [Mycoplasmatota bacterium]
MDKEVVELYLDDIIPNRFQPREVFNEEALRELSASIKEHGVIQPIIVRKIGDKYEIIAGERRYKASALAGLTKIPAIIRNLDDKEASKVALLENLQRKDLTAIEEARTYQKILELDSMTQEELGRTMGKSQAAIANKMRLLSLPDEVQEALLKDQISERHARSLLNLDTPEEQINMLRKIISNRMTVRELDNEIRELKGETSIPSTINNDSVTIVNETGPKVEVNNNESHEVPTLNLPESPSNELDDDFSPLSFIPKDDTPEVLEALSDIEAPEPIEEKSTTDDFKAIDNLLKSTKLYTMEDAVNEIKSVVAKIQNKGIKITTDDMDFEKTYQIVIKIDKNN